jgi:hypothetical protein
MRGLLAARVQPGSAELGAAGIGRALLEHGADAKCGPTMLFDAIRKFKPIDGVALAPFEHGADPDSTASEGEMALHVAARVRSDSVKALPKTGADERPTTDAGNTVLHGSVRRPSGPRYGWHEQRGWTSSA